MKKAHIILVRKNSARVGRWALMFLAALVVLYFFGMIWYDGPGASGGIWNALLSILWLGGGIFLWRKYRIRNHRLILCVVALAVILIPRAFIQPSNDRDWSPEFAKTGSSTRQDDVVTFKNVRNFSYTREEDIIERWETKTVRLSNFKSMDLFHTTFGADRIAHPILSFDFGPDGRICLTVETRREKGEGFSVIGGLYKMFELQYLFTMEEDSVRLRASVRDEKVYMYRIDMPRDEALALFLSATDVQNDLAKKPRFYHIMFSNCTTSLRERLPKDQRGKFDIRMLFNGMLDEYLYENGKIKTDGLSFSELRKRAYINPVAQDAHDSPEFSRIIREGRPGME